MDQKPFCLNWKVSIPQEQKHTYFYLSFVCSVNVRCRVSRGPMSSIFASTLASFMLKVKKKKKKKKRIPTDRPTLWKVISGQSNNLFFFGLRGVRLKKVHFLGPKGPLFGGPAPPQNRSWLRAWKVHPADGYRGRLPAIALA